MTMFFYWQRNILGMWHPRKSETMPGGKGSTGEWRGKIARVTELRPDEVFTDIDTLAIRYPLEG